MTMIGLLARRNRVLIGAWLVLLVGLGGATVWAYQSTYDTPQQRAAAVATARADAATTALYGELPLPGRPAQMFAWEIGGIVTILAAIFAVLLAVALTRATADDGTLELVRGSGAGPREPLLAAVAVLGGVALVLATGTALAVGLWSGSVDGVDPPGAAAFGAVLGATFLLIGLVTVVLAQLTTTATLARRLGFAAVGVAVALRALADVRHVPALQWLSPLGLRATVRPFTDERWWVLGAALTVAGALAGVAAGLSGRSESRARARTGRLRVRSVLGLQLRLGAPGGLVWAAGTALLAGLFTEMGAGAVHNDAGGFIGAQLGTEDPVAGFSRYTATVVALVVCAYAILRTLEHRHDEAAGRAGLVLSTGVRRSAQLLAHVVAGAAGGAAVLLVAGAAAALVAPSALGGPGTGWRMFGYVVGQWPATAAMAGGAALFAGCLPRLTALAWLPLAAGGGLALLGPLLGAPAALSDLGPFAHHGWPGLVALTAVAVVTAGAGLAGIARRDLRTD